VLEQITKENKAANKEISGRSETEKKRENPDEHPDSKQNAKKNSIPDAGGAAEENTKSQANKIKREKISTTNQTIFTSKTRHKNGNQE
jgi:hypothetical protein